MWEVPFVNRSLTPTLYLSRSSDVLANVRGGAVLSPESDVALIEHYAKDASLSAVLHRGWVRKIGGKSGMKWQRRWFVVLDSGILYYFKQENEKNVRGMLYAGNALWRCQETETFENSLPAGGGRFMFTITSRTSTDSAAAKCLRFSVDCDEAKSQWVEVLSVLSLRNLRQMMVPIARYIRRKAIDTEGLFRVSGGAAAIEELKTQESRGQRLPFDEPDMSSCHADAHALASFLKHCIRCLPVPLIPDWAHGRLATLEGSMETIAARAKSVLTTLPYPHQQILRYLFHFLHDVSQHHEKNKMHSDNLAIVFAPNLFRDDVSLCIIKSRSDAE